MRIAKLEGATHQIKYIDYDTGLRASFYMKKCKVDGKTVWYRWIFHKEWQECQPHWWIRLWYIRKL